MSRRSFLQGVYFGGFTPLGSNIAIERVASQQNTDLLFVRTDSLTSDGHKTMVITDDGVVIQDYKKSGDSILYDSAGAVYTVNITLNKNGHITCKNLTNEGSDFAEAFWSTEPLQPGMAVVVTENNKVRRARPGERPDGVVVTKDHLGIVGGVQSTPDAVVRDGLNRVVRDENGTPVRVPAIGFSRPRLEADDVYVVALVGRVPVLVSEPVDERWKPIGPEKDGARLHLIR